MHRFPGARYTILAGPLTVEFIITAGAKGKGQSVNCKMQKAKGKRAKGKGTGEKAKGKVQSAKCKVQKAKCTMHDEKHATMPEIEKACRKILGDKIYGVNSDTLEARVGALLKAGGQTLSCAESCTGGLLSSLITDVPGSSSYFRGSLIAYSNAAKTRLLNVRPETLKHHGAVSEPCAREMALGAKKIFSSDYELAITGIAGPEGGTPEKPVGTVCFALTGPQIKRTFTRRFNGPRSFIRRCAANFALDELRKVIE